MFRKTTTMFAASLLAASSTYAQDLDATVVRDPAANLAIYTATVQAPPGSNYFLFGSVFLSQNPIQFPGVFNALFLDPIHTVTIDSFVPVLPTGPFGPGIGQSQLRLPADFWSGVPVCLQAVVIDPANNLAFANHAIANQGGVLGAGPLGFCLEWWGTYDPRNQRYSMQFKGNAGDNVEMRVNGGQKASGGVVLGPNGRGSVTMPIPGGLQRGDQVEIYKNGNLVKSWRYQP